MHISRLFHIIFFLTVALCCNAKQYTLVIDAGHGGHDTGAVGEYSKEKDINLKVALAFGKYVENNMPGVKVIYTRKTDVFIPLIERANIANKNHADFFISVHTNAVPKPGIAYGIETYTMGLRRSNEKFSAALRENEVITYEKNYREKYNGYDPKSPESLIMFELIHDNNMSESVSMAKYIQSSICAETGHLNKGVKQDVFLVLRETSMPACLVELGFISTPEEEQFLNSAAGVDKLALGIYKGFAKYSKQGSSNVNSSGVVSSTPTPPTTTQTPKPVAPAKKPEAPAKKPEAKPVQPAAKTQPMAEKPAFNPNLKSTYKVIILSSSTPIPANDARFKGKKVQDFNDRGVHRYSILDTADKQEAYNKRAEMANDFPQAFVITLQNGVRVK